MPGELRRKSRGIAAGYRGSCQDLIDGANESYDGANES
jgi:hypothetical protein